MDGIYVVQLSLGGFGEPGLDVELGRDRYLEGLKSGNEVISGREGEQNAGVCEGPCPEREKLLVPTPLFSPGAKLGSKSLGSGNTMPLCHCFASRVVRGAFKSLHSL